MTSADCACRTPLGVDLTTALGHLVPAEEGVMATHSGREWQLCRAAGSVRFAGMFRGNALGDTPAAGRS